MNTKQHPNLNQVLSVLQMREKNMRLIDISKLTGLSISKINTIIKRPPPEWNILKKEGK